MESGPIYRSTDDGWWWTPLTRSANHLAIHPNGDPFALGDVVARSRDDGASWTILSAAPSTNVLIATPSGGLLAGTQQGIFRSDDDGHSWQLASLGAVRVELLEIGPDGALYAAANNDFVRSDSDGERWTPIAHLPTPIEAFAPRAQGGWWIGTYGSPYCPGYPGGLFRFDGIAPPQWISTPFLTVNAIFTRADGTLFVGDASYCASDRVAPWLGGTRSRRDRGSWKKRILSRSFVGGEARKMALDTNASRPLSTLALHVAFACILSALAAPASAESFFQSTSGPPGGSVLDLARQPDGDLFAAMRYGPIYRSTDDGWLWTPLQRSATRLAVVSNGDLYALGEVVQRSLDDGASWTALTAPQSNTMILLSSGRLLAGTQNGIYRSDDDGATWHPSGLASTNVRKLVIGPDGHVYGAANKDLVISEDAGDQWRVLATLTNVITTLAPRTQGGFWIGTASIPFPPYPVGGLYRYAGSGPPELISPFITVIALGVRSDGRVFVADSGYCGVQTPGSLYSSNDGSDWSIDAWTQISAIVPGDANEIFVATAGLCDRGTTDGQGVFWSDGPEVSLTSRSRGLAHATSGIIAAARGIVYAQGDYDLYWSTDHGVSWNTTGRMGTTLYHIRIAAHPAGDVFATSRWISKPTKADGNSRSASFFFVRTRDRGATWTSLVAPGVDILENGVVVTARGSVLVLADGGVSRSTDRGDTWSTPNSAPLSQWGSVLASGPMSRVFGTGTDGIYLSEDDGVSFAPISGLQARRDGPIAVARNEKSVYFDTDAGIRALLETSPGVWSEEPLPALSGPTHALITDFEGTVYASVFVHDSPLVTGVWRLLRGATIWEKIEETIVSGFVFDDSGYLYCGTGTRGVLRSRMPLRAPTDALLAQFGIMAWHAGPSPFRDNTAFDLKLGAAQRVSLDLFDVRGRAVSTLWRGSELPAGRNVASWQPDPRLPSGAYFYRLRVGGAVRSGRVTLIR